MIEQHKVKIASRPRRTWLQTLNALLFFVAFISGCLMINSFQFAFLLPLKPLPFQCTTKLYVEGVRYSKGAFGSLLVLMTQWFAPTQLVVSFERDGPGKFTEEEYKYLIVRDQAGKVIALNLPPQAVLIANHQIYADWWYAWCLTYFTGTYKDVYIVLKKSLKWVPMVGWGMQIYDFIFLARSWASDRLYLAERLSRLGRRSDKEDTPLTFILYPEGTLVSPDTRPISKKFADKLGISDTLHTLLPRSTGLQYSLRALAPRIPTLQMIDITMAYPGIPPLGYGQDYYTLRSIFFDGVPPPAVHMHIRHFDVREEVPIGDLSNTNVDVLPNGSGTKSAAEVDIPMKEKEAFDLWLRGLWREKDRMITTFLETGHLINSAEVLHIPLELKHKRDILDAYCFAIPAVAGWIWSKLR